MLQILHGPPSLQQIVLMWDNLRPRMVEVKSRPQYLVVRCTGNTTSRGRPTFPICYTAVCAIREGVVFRHASTGYPMVSRRNSTGFCTRAFSRNPQQFRGFFTCFAHDCRAEYQQRNGADFHQLFRAFSFWKKGEKQAESIICGKADLSGLYHYIWGSRTGVHTECGTWNIFPVAVSTCRLRRLRRILHPVPFSARTLAGVERRSRRSRARRRIR